ncbi:MAG: GIY-YIG nuclease family protein [Thermodesulfobacteriota bacterium]
MDKGTYNLIINLPSDKFLQIGKLGRFLFEKGYYVYTGSAKRGLDARISRHKRKEKALHWHIDYLLEDAVIIDVKVYAEGLLSECELNQKVFKMEGAEVLAHGFGASDCKCKSHLAYFRKLPYSIP